MFYRKKTVIIEAVTWYGKYSDPSEWPDWFNMALAQKAIAPSPLNQKLYIDTLEGLMAVDVGDKVIQGVKGEIYPCKPDIFEATYEAVQP